MMCSDKHWPQSVQVLPRKTALSCARAAWSASALATSFVVRGASALFTLSVLGTSVAPPLLLPAVAALPAAVLHAGAAAMALKESRLRLLLMRAFIFSSTLAFCSSVKSHRNACRVLPLAAASASCCWMKSLEHAVHARSP